MIPNVLKCATIIDLQMGRPETYPNRFGHRCRVAKAFVRMFSPDDTKVDHYPSNPFTGRISRTKKPFKDGFSSNAPLPPSSSLESTEGAAGYVEDAVKGVVAGFPKPEDAEPNWTGATTVSSMLCSAKAFTTVCSPGT
jgi:hypothetical protein